MLGPMSYPWGYNATLLVCWADRLGSCAWLHRRWHVIISIVSLGHFSAFIEFLGHVTDFVLGTKHFVKTINCYIFFIFGVLFWLSYAILMQMLMWNSFFTNAANVYLTHSFLMNQLMCLSLWKYVDIEWKQTVFPKSLLLGTCDK